MQTILIIVHVLVAAGLVGLVLMQHGRGADAGAAFGSGASSTVFGSRGSASFLTRLTAGLAMTFFATSLTLAYLAGQREEPTSVVESAPPAAEEVPAPAPQPQQAPQADDVPAVPGESASDVPVPAGSESN